MSEYQYINPEKDPPITPNMLLDQETIDGMREAIKKARPLMRDGNWPHQYVSDVWMLLVERERRMELAKQALAQQQLREDHDIHIVIDRKGLDSDEMCYVYTITYLAPENKTTKHWVGALTQIDSFHGYGSTYGGGWDTYEQALEAAITKALTLI